MAWQRLEDGVNTEQILRRWPSQRPLLLFGGPASHFQIIALTYTERPWQELEDERLDAAAYHPERANDAKALGLPFTGGYMGFIAYDDYTNAKAGQSAPTSRVYAIESALVINRLQQAAYVVGSSPEAGRVLLSQLNSTEVQQQGWQGGEPWSWRSDFDQADYMRKVGLCLEDIRAGRFYQMNLLRFFELVSSQPSAQQWLHRWWQHSGPFGAVLWQPDLQLVSCSPERFIQIQPKESTLTLRLMSQPIKGTVGVSPDPEENARRRQWLASSKKDLAELSMIVDLIRNDMYRVSQPHSVQVIDPGSIHSFQHVHHRIATLVSDLRSDLNMRDLFRALCPGGSITGAPKWEVMQAIRAYEGRDRGFMMGHAFYWDPHLARFDSSILIRTAWSEPGKPWQFAAGSGLVLASDPQAEYEEINAKTKVFIDHLTD